MNSADSTSRLSDGLNPLLDLAEVMSGRALTALTSPEVDLDVVVNGFVRQPLLPKDLLAAVAASYENISERPLAAGANGSRDLAGAVGFCALAQGLDYSVHHGSAPVDFAKLLGDPRVTTELLRWYRYTGPELAFDTAEAPITGTTSCILRCAVASDRADQALKLVLPRYADSPQITDRTADYKAFLEGVPNTPVVHDSQDRYIRMAWVQAPTLADFRELLPSRLADRRGTEGGDFIASREAFQNLRKFAESLCSALAEYDSLRLPRHRDGLRHLDLSPSNIFVERDRDEYRLTFIDFGINFLVGETAATPKALVDASLYIAPEIRRRDALSAEGERKADLYSTGMLFLQVLLKNRVTPETAATLLRDAWEHAPGWARIVEELVNEEPVERMALKPLDYDSSYEYVTDLAVQEDDAIGVFGAGEHKDDAAGEPRLFRWWDLRSFDDFREIQAAAMAKVAGDRYPRSLARWAAISIIWWVAILYVFGDLTVADLGGDTPFAGVLHSMFGHSLRFSIGPEVHNHWGNLKHNLPGRLVGLTFGMCAVAYYMNIFSTLSLNGITGTRPASFFLRASAWFPGIPIAVLLLYDPDLWPYMSFAGAVPVTINNYLMSRLVDRSVNAEQGDVGRRMPETRSRNAAFRKVFVNWWVLMLLYATFLALTGILIDVGTIPKTAYYAFVVALGVNYPKLYQLNSVKETPRVRGNLLRALFVLRVKDAWTVQRQALASVFDVLDGDNVHVSSGGVAARLPAGLIPEFRTVVANHEDHLDSLSPPGEKVPEGVS